VITVVIIGSQGKVLIIPRHGAKELSQGVLIDILKNAGIKK
jgi:predicted RNA binding protein YcfA (HicA-like mRNA interferase family)